MPNPPQSTELGHSTSSTTTPSTIDLISAAANRNHHQTTADVTDTASTLNQDSSWAIDPSADSALAAHIFVSSSRPFYENCSDGGTVFLEPLSSERVTKKRSHTDQTAFLTHQSSDSWPLSLDPLLDTAAELIYDPTGQLEPLPNSVFSTSNNPSISSPIARPTHSETTALAVITDVTATNDGGNKVLSSSTHTTYPRPVLKRLPASNAEADVLSTAAPSAQELRPRVAGTDPRKYRQVSFERMSGRGATSPDGGSTSSDAPSADFQSAHIEPAPGARCDQSPAASEVSSTREAAIHTPAVDGSTRPASLSTHRGSRDPSGHPPPILPPEKVFPIQIGSELFRLSGASISSDAPSYFTQFFEEQYRHNEDTRGVRTLYIDRDPETFRDVARHLQGYYVKPRDGSHFVKLFADAQFYSLPRLIDQLFQSEIYIQIGEKHFQIPKDIFSDPGNSPNFFSLGFAVFFSSPGEVFPGLDRRGLLRPPSITPPYVPGRSAETFAQLLQLLRGYPLQIRNESHRAELLRDCRYFHLRGLEQKIIAHDISYNLDRGKHEICIRIEDVRPSGISYKPSHSEQSESDLMGGWVHYARPFVDDDSYELIVEIGGELTVLDLGDMRVDFHGLAKARISSLFQVVANKMNLPIDAPLGLMMLSGGQKIRSTSPGNTPLSKDRVKVQFESETDIELDNQPFDAECASSPSRPESEKPHGRGQLGRDTPTLPKQSGTDASVGYERPTKKRKRAASSDHPKAQKWTIRSGQWRLKVQPTVFESGHQGYEIVLIAVKVDAFSHERARNASRKFLGSIMT